MAKKEATRAYVLREGKKHWDRDEDGALVEKTGPDVVMLSESAYRAFEDKFVDPEKESERLANLLELQKTMNKANELNNGAPLPEAAVPASTPGIPQDDSAKHSAAVVTPAVKPPVAPPTNPSDTHKAPGTSPSGKN